MMTGGRSCCCCCWWWWGGGCWWWWWCCGGATGGLRILWESLWTRRGAGRGPWSDRGDLPVGFSGESMVVEIEILGKVRGEIGCVYLFVHMYVVGIFNLGNKLINIYLRKMPG
ncbi:hypothetical protein HanIR_Chr04g0170311 [Helianthus annuus]|nr:hypothetical protein HanIR_Chr04g0170311 [Helianthus annuus]